MQSEIPEHAAAQRGLKPVETERNLVETERKLPNVRGRAQGDIWSAPLQVRMGHSLAPISPGAGSATIFTEPHRSAPLRKR